MISGAAEQELHRKSARLFNVYAMFVTAEMLQSIGETQHLHSGLVGS